MLRYFIALAIGVLTIHSSHAFGDEELWKGKPPEGEVSFGLGAGLAPLGSSGGFVSILHLGKKIVHTGFVPDINNQVWIEAAGGFHYGFNSTWWSGLFSAHLRWDFIINPEWTLMAMGGVGGWFNNVGGFTTVVVHPRIAAGAVYYFTPQVGLRIDVSHEWTTLGLQVRLP
jgi:hypothetical protein